MAIGIGILIKGISVFREKIPVVIQEIGIFLIEKVRIVHLLNTNWCKSWTGAQRIVFLAVELL